VAPLGVLSQAKHQVSHLEASGPNALGVVAPDDCFATAHSMCSD
jgi:hypothetical protein